MPHVQSAVDAANDCEAKPCTSSSPGRGKAHASPHRCHLAVFLWLTTVSNSPANERPANDGNITVNGISQRVVTSTVQFRTLPDNAFLVPLPFRLTGVVTLVDTNRNLAVLQDDTGAVALHFDLTGSHLQVGQLVSMEGSNCHPYAVSLPEYPYHPSGRDLRWSFEAPSDWGDYYLTRMRGFLHPPVTGLYTFWVASDNSSELWISPNDDPSKIKRIAFIPRYGWVAPREWSHFPSQRSEPILLEAEHSYYIEAFQEQTTYANHLSVAWQGPGVDQSVIDNRFITPWKENLDSISLGATNGILREYWTNYSAGNLAVLTGPKPFDSALSVEDLTVKTIDSGQLPAPAPIQINQRLLPADNYRWVETDGRVDFVGNDNGMALLELSDGPTQDSSSAPRACRRNCCTTPPPPLCASKAYAKASTTPMETSCRA